MKRLYQWLSEQASFFRYNAAGDGTRISTLRTEVTVRREGMTLVVGGAAIVGPDNCPLCGSKLVQEQASAQQTIVAK